MGLRFSKRIRVIPGVRLNLGLRGLSLGLGPRGSSIGIGQRGVYGNLGIPGSGLSLRERLDTSAGQPRRVSRVGSDPLPDQFTIQVPLGKGGAVILRSIDDEPLPHAMSEGLFKTRGKQISEQVQQACSEYGRQVAQARDIHLATPAPNPPSAYSASDFGSESPVAPRPLKYHWLLRLFESHRIRIDHANREANSVHAQAMNTWADGKAVHDAHQRALRDAFALAAAGDVTGYEEVLNAVLEEIDWPYETSVSWEVACSKVALDIDLPEIEHLPTGLPAPAGRGGREIKIKALTDTAKRRAYALHVHAVVLRCAGEIFHALPFVQEAVISANTQRIDSATGQLSDDYILSVSIARDAWEKIDFSKLETISPIDALERFDLRRSMTKTGIFRPVAPIDSPIS